MQIGCGLFGVLKVRSKYKRLIYDGIRERFIFLTFRKPKSMVKAEDVSSAFFVRGVTDFTTDRCRTARGSAGKDERSDVNSENTSPTKILRYNSDH